MHVIHFIYVCKPIMPLNVMTLQFKILYLAFMTLDHNADSRLRIKQEINIIQLYSLVT